MAVGRVLLCLSFFVFPIKLHAREVSITILNTTDLHGRLLPARDYQKRDGMGGLARCATLIRKIRSETPNVVLLDCGDLVQGSIESYLTRGRIMVKALAHLEYDAWVLGNHEFDWGLDHLARILQASKVPVLGANIKTRDGVTFTLPTVRPYLVKEFEGVRVAVVGLTTPGIPSWSRPNLISPLGFQNSVECLRSILPEIRRHRPDVWILAVHQGYKKRGDDFANQVRALAQSFPEVDVILGGHTHQVRHGFRVKDVLYSQAGYHGIWLGRTDVVYDTVKKQVSRIESVALPVEDRYSEDESLLKLFKKDIEKAIQWRDSEVGTLQDKFSSSSSIRGLSDVQRLICRAIFAEGDIDVVIHGSLSDESLASGPVTVGDVWRIIPYENRIGIVSLTLAELNEVLEENATHFGTRHFMGAMGITYDLDQQAEKGRRVMNTRLVHGDQPHPRERINVALNSYVLASGGRRFMRLRQLADQAASRLRMTEIETRQAVMKYIKEYSPLRAEGTPALRIVNSASP